MARVSINTNVKQFHPEIQSCKALVQNNPRIFQHLPLTHLPGIIIMHLFDCHCSDCKERKRLEIEEKSKCDPGLILQKKIRQQIDDTQGEDVHNQFQSIFFGLTGRVEEHDLPLCP
jgi:hypothetical protein